MAEITSESILDKALEEHMAKVKKKILARANEIASQDGEKDISVTHLATAINEYAPGSPGLFTEKTNCKRTFFDYFPPVAILSAVLAFSFAGLGLWALLGQSNIKELGSQGFLDIAKIFAGAIVGSATAAVATSNRQAKG